MHVTLIRPPKITTDFAPHTQSGVPPLALACLAAVLEEAGHSVAVIDAYGEAPSRAVDIPGTNLNTVGLTADEIAARIPTHTDVIGVTCMFSQDWLYAKHVIAAAHAAVPDASIVAGGEHVTADPAHVLRTAPAVTACVLGEGEETLVDFIDAVGHDRDPKSVTGLVLRGADGAPVNTGARERIRAIDDLPWPAWHLVPTLAVYLDNHFGFEEQNRRAMPLMATRGCPYRCTFCSSPSMWGTNWLARDPRDVIEEIKYYHRRYAIEHIEFYDLTAIVDRRWILEFTRLFSAERLPLTWRLPSGTRSEALDEDVLRAMVASGCEAIVYAPESGSPRTLARIKKKVKPDRMLRSMRAAVRAGMHVRGHFIMGMPGQTLSEVAETFLFIARMAWAGVHDANTYFFYPYPGSEMYRALVAEGKIDPSAASYDELLAGACFTDFKAIRSWSEHFSPAMLRFLCLGSMAWFYCLSFLFWPFRPMQTLWRVFRGRPFTWIERFLHAGFRQYVLGHKVSRVEIRRPLATGLTLDGVALAAERPTRSRNTRAARVASRA
ncbi:MAG TPA: radical SAM protein [Candidatus Binatia bacterium]|nr:radical SAM protein [Candidatus Binatia bacterium]